LTVTWQSEGGGAPDAAAIPPVVVRPLIPASLVTPAEQTLEAGGETREAVFTVTPLALGTVQGARVEATPPQGGRFDVTLPMKIVRQRATKVLLLLTVLVPALYLYLTKSLAEDLRGPYPASKLKGRLREEYVHPPRAQPVQGGPGQQGNRGPRQNQGGRQGVNAPPVQLIPPGGNRMIPLTEGEMLEQLILENSPDIPYFTEYVAYGLGEAYHFVTTFSEENPVAFWLGFALLVMTGMSWFAHMTSRARRRSKPLQFARTTAPRPPAPHRPGDTAEPIVVEPID
jgi:hypothetical protein